MGEKGEYPSEIPWSAGGFFFMHDMELQQTPGGSESSILSWYSSFTVTFGSNFHVCTDSQSNQNKVNWSSVKILQECWPLNTKRKGNVKICYCCLAHHIFVSGRNKWKLWNTALEFHFFRKGLVPWDPSGIKVSENLVLSVRHKLWPISTESFR